MAGELRRNPISGTVVIVAPDREKPLEKLRRQKPRDWSRINPKLLSGESCPFEEGHETETPPEIRSYRQTGTKPNEPGWWVRVVPNLMPAVDSSIASELPAIERRGPFFVTPAFGYHYVIIESPKHQDTLETVPDHQCREVLHMWRDMTFQAGSDRNILSVLIFKNHGPLAGASQPHPHSQLIALPMVPPRLDNEFRGARAYWENNKSCFYCNEREWELLSEKRLIEVTDNFLAWCPYTSKGPYQIIIGPRTHQSYFANVANVPQGSDPLTEFALLLQRTLRRLRLVLDDPDYSLYFHTASATRVENEYYHWHCQIEPVTEAIPAGFEKGFGAYINPRSPEKCAEDLREAKI